MNIMFIITGLGLGGAETQVCNLCDEFTSLGHDVNLVYLHGDKVASPQNERVNIYSIDLKKSPLSLLLSFFRLIKLINEIKPDVIHSHMVHANLMARISRIFCTIPVLISTAHSTNEGGSLRMLAYRYTDKLADITTNVSQVAVDTFIEKKASFPSRIIVVPNGVNTSVFEYDPLFKKYIRDKLAVRAHERMILAVGRNDPAKDYDNLLSAIAMLPPNLSVKIFVVGLNTELLISQANKLGILDKTFFLGLRKDIPALMTAADIFVMSSEWEGLPIVIGEAMACQCAIATTDAGGAAQWLSNRDYVVPIKNSKELSNVLVKLVKLPLDKLSEIGQENRKHIIKSFSLSSITKQWLSIYNKFL